MAQQSQEYIGGFHAVTAAVQQGQAVTAIWLAAQRRDERSRALLALAQERRISVHEADMTALDAMLPQVRHQGCVAELGLVQAYRESQLPQLLAAADAPWVLALDQVQDPHNLGACLRSAAAAGVTAVIAPRKRAAGITATVRKVAVGATERVPFVPVTNLTRALQRLQKDGFWAIGLAGEVDTRLYDVDLRGRLVLVLGGEARGLRERTRTACDVLASIPMHNDMESLNVSVAAGVALFEALRQRLSN
ncbi:MAG TPA: 23S rRNA (guanosine(2251)-2'-O)-methyltransferase RlmB [Salinisphaeraceae bacterium]|nr:23S rRNA (guanosine(2251)-2'-O)-methyltransferase RlmB [Salinisphaeraceae bacterium]